MNENAKHLQPVVEVTKLSEKPSSRSMVLTSPGSTVTLTTPSLEGKTSTGELDSQSLTAGSGT